MVAAHCCRTFSESLIRWITRSWVRLDPGCLHLSAFIFSSCVSWVYMEFDVAIVRQFAFMENVGSILHRKQTMRAVIHYIVQDP